MRKKYYSTIGLEIHAELKTRTKMFCPCKNDPNEKKPNVNICPICVAHPGTLPVINKKAMKNVIKVGLVLGGKIANFTEFNRKNYFYPDIPKGYQISQYKYPMVLGGHLSDFDITRIHLEEDTANNKHDRGDYSLVDFNRAGIPLMELVTKPNTFENTEDTAKSALNFAKEFQLILWYLDVSEANMEKGEMRVEANISVSENKNKLGIKVEVKNLNSFKSVEKAIKFELVRMIKLLENGKGEDIIQETRGWDERKQKTFSQRKKESSQDYRYFPEPDLPKLKLHEIFNLEKMKKELLKLELPQAKRLRYKKRFGIKDEDIEIFINDKILSNWFEDITKILNDREKIKIVSNYITSDFLGLKKNNPKIKMPSAKNMAELSSMLKEALINSRVAKDILIIIVKNDKSPMKIAKEKNLLQKNDKKELKKIAQKIIDANQKIVIDYKGGKKPALMFLMGQIMKETKGSANPFITKQILIDLLK